MVIQKLHFSDGCGGIKMQQAHYVNHVSVVPVEGLSRKELFDGIEIKNWGHWQKEPIEIKAGQEETIRRLQRWIPEFIDETAQPGRLQCPNIFVATHYDIPLGNGRVSATVEIHDDLRESILGVGLGTGGGINREEIIDLFNGKSGVVVRAYYTIGAAMKEKEYN